MDTPITESSLQEIGFQVEEDDRGFEVWSMHGVEVWDFNGKYWLVDRLDQAGIDREFRYLEELEQFFIGCGLSLYQTDKEC